MKKVVSILLAVVLVFGMLPASAFTALAADEGTWTLVTDASDLAAGDQLVIAETTNSKGDFVAGSISSSVMASVTATFSADATSITSLPDTAVILTLGGSEGSWTLSNSDGKLLGATAVKKLAWGSGTTTWSISISNGAATIQNGTSSYGRFLYNVNSPRFTTYTSNTSSSMVLPQLYRLESSGGETTCAHANTEILAAQDATCTQTGLTEGEVCLDCGKTITEQTEISVIDHNYVDGSCSECGAAEPEPYTLVTSVDDLKEGNTVVIVATGDNYALSTTQNTNNRGRAEVEKSENNSVVTFGDDVQVLTLGKDSTANTYTFSTGSGYLYAAGGTSNNYLKTDTTLSNVCYWTIEINDTGVATIKAADTTIARNWLRYNSTNSIFSCYASGQSDVAIYKLDSGTEEEPCDHSLTVTIPEVPATCITAGTAEIQKCACGETVVGGEEIAALDHSMDEGICSRCGLYEHQADLMTTLPGNGDVIIIHHVSSNNALGLAAKNDDLIGISTTPAENKLPYYTTVAQLTVCIVDGSFTFATADGMYLTTDANNTLSFADTLTDNGKWVVTLTDGNFFIENAYATNDSGVALALEYYYEAFTTYSTNTTAAYQMQLYMVEQGENTCTHESTEEQTDGCAAGCLTAGLTNSVKCLDCGIPVTPQEEIPALGHNYVDYICTRCGDEQKVGNYVRVSSIEDITDGQYVIVAEVDGAYYAMNNQLSSGKFETTSVDVNNYTVSTANAPVWTVTVSGDNVTLQAEAGYLNYNSSTNFKFAEDAYEWSVTPGEDATTFILNSTAVERGVYYQIGSKFGAYAQSNANNKAYCAYLQLYKFVQPVAAYENGTWVGYNTVEKALENSNQIKLYADAETIAVTGDLYLDLNGFKATNVTATKIYAYDSSATAAAAGTGSITTSSEVVMDNTVNNIRYIALAEGEEEIKTYTFHVLEMKLSAVTLRANEDCGIYYKATYACDNTLAGAIDSYGVVFSLQDMPGADFKTEANGRNLYTAYDKENFKSGEEVTSGSIFGIMKQGLTNNAERGKMDIHANAYIEINGQTLVGTGASYSLFTVMKAMNDNWEKYEEAGKTDAIKAFYEMWKDEGMSDWAAELPNIVG